jgi:hypothetical protein
MELDSFDRVRVVRDTDDGGEWGTATLLAVRGWAATAKTSDYTAVSSDDVILVNAFAGAVTVTLPPASDNYANSFKIKKIDATSLPVTIDGNGTTIDGGSTAVITSRYVSLTVQCDGIEWWIV